MTLEIELSRLREAASRPPPATPPPTAKPPAAPSSVGISTPQEPSPSPSTSPARLLGCYPRTADPGADYGKAAQDEAISAFGSQLDELARAMVPELINPRGVNSMSRLALLAAFQETLPEVKTRQGMEALRDEALLAPLYRHLVLEWLLKRLWAEPLALLGSASHGQVLEGAGGWDSSDEEKEAALQLDVAAYRRLYKQWCEQVDVMAGYSSAGFSTASVVASTMGAETSAQALQQFWVSKPLAQAHKDFCYQFGISTGCRIARELLVQAYMLRLLMGASHPELRPCISAPGDAFSSSRHQQARLISRTVPHDSSSEQSDGSDGSGPAGAPKQVLVSRSPGWRHLFAGPAAQMHRREEVVVMALVPAEAASHRSKRAALFTWAPADVDG